VIALRVTQFTVVTIVVHLELLVLVVECVKVRQSVRQELTIVVMAPAVRMVQGAVVMECAMMIPNQPVQMTHQSNALMDDAALKLIRIVEVMDSAMRVILMILKIKRAALVCLLASLTSATLTEFTAAQQDILT